MTSPRCGSTILGQGSPGSKDASYMQALFVRIAFELDAFQKNLAVKYFFGKL